MPPRGSPRPVLGQRTRKGGLWARRSANQKRGNDDTLGYELRGGAEKDQRHQRRQTSAHPSAMDQAPGGRVEPAPGCRVPAPVQRDPAVQPLLPRAALRQLSQSEVARPHGRGRLRRRHRQSLLKRRAPLAALSPDGRGVRHQRRRDVHDRIRCRSAGGAGLFDRNLCQQLS